MLPQPINARVVSFMMLTIQDAHGVRQDMRTIALLRVFVVSAVSGVAGIYFIM